MKRLAIGILAHVDSGKTTLLESLLYNSGVIATPGRVDYKNSFLDNHNIERDRGITIFSKQAMLCTKDNELALIDTPGHVDFSAEMERTLQIIDYAILVVSATEGVQSHTQTLWNLLKIYNIPTFIFINKMDIKREEKEVIFSDIKDKLGAECVDFTDKNESFYENIALLNEELLEEFLESGKILDEEICDAVAMRKVFPCFFGSALKNENVREFLQDFLKLTKEKEYNSEFGAKVFKIAEDEKGQRLVYLKITGGSLKVKTLLKGNDWEEKVNEIRIYSGAKYKSVSEVSQGSVCAVTGLSKASANEGLGFEKSIRELISEPVFSYSVTLLDDIDIHSAYEIFKKLEEEETKLNISLNKREQSINIAVMGEVQLEVLKRILEERFNLRVEFSHGNVIYRETIENTVLGVGHFEPLRHYAEVHLEIEPLKRGDGLEFVSGCSFDKLERNWQRLILTHLKEKEHIGVLTGSALTDVKITLVNGKAHKKHTEGGDFRQATYRAVRQGLMQAKSILLEPWYDFKVELPMECSGRAMSDFSQMGAQFSQPEIFGNLTIIKGRAPVVKIRDYQKKLTVYTKGEGKISFGFSGYEKCTDQEEIIKKTGYSWQDDVENTPDSVFCSHGAGYIVKWDKVFENMHLETKKISIQSEEKAQRRLVYSDMIADEEELLRIFEKTYGKIKRRTHTMLRTQKEAPEYKPKPVVRQEEYLLIDGYNIIYADKEFSQMASYSLEDARILLTDRVSSYQAMKNINIILVFDAYRVKGNTEKIEKVHGISVVYTKEAETADTYIEKTSKKLMKNYKVKVATSDAVEQLIIFGNGAMRITAQEFLGELDKNDEEIRKFIKENNV